MVLTRSDDRSQKISSTRETKCNNKSLINRGENSAKSEKEESTLKVKEKLRCIDNQLSDDFGSRGRRK